MNGLAVFIGYIFGLLTSSAITIAALNTLFDLGIEYGILEILSIFWFTAVLSGITIKHNKKG